MNILITGGTGNIGKAVIRYIYKYTASNTHEDIDFTAISRNGGLIEADDNVVAVESLDLNRSWDYLRLWVREQKEQFDLVVVAHGTQRPATIKHMVESNWYSIWYDNLSSVVGLVQALVKENKLTPNALIVLCSSIQANTPRVGRGMYAMAKAALEAFAKTIAIELAPIRCVALRLGQLTETMANIEFDPIEKNKLEKRALVDWVDPKEIAFLIFSLYHTSSITGCIIDVDSGHGRNVW